MMGRIRTGLLLAAALGLTGAVACSSSENVPGSDTTQGGVVDASITGDAAARDGAAAGDAGAAGQQDAGAPFQITECSLGQVAGIALALVNQGLQAANLGLSTSTNPAVKAFAQQVVNADTAYLQRLQSLGITPVSSDISTTIDAQTALILNATRSSTNFDRDYIAGTIVGLMTAVGFTDHLTANDASAAQVAALKSSALLLIQNQLQAAFMLQADIVGACGTPGVDAGACGDAGAAMDSGAAMDAGAAQSDAGM